MAGDWLSEISAALGNQSMLGFLQHVISVVRDQDLGYFLDETWFHYFIWAV